MVRSKVTAAISAGVFVGLLSHGLATEAQIYKWVDEKGTIHFSDDPPARTEGTTPVQVIPSEARSPMVKNGPPPPSSDSEARPGEEDMSEIERRGMGETLESDVESPPVVVVEGGRDPSVRFRALSPRNRPGQPIRPPIRPPVRHPRRYPHR